VLSPACLRFLIANLLLATLQANAAVTAAITLSTEAIHENRALCDKFLQFGIVLAIGMLISKTTAYRM